MPSSAWTSSGTAHAACTRSTGASASTPTTGSAALDPPLCLLSRPAMHIGAAYSSDTELSPIYLSHALLNAQAGMPLFGRP